MGLTRRIPTLPALTWTIALVWFAVLTFCVLQGPLLPGHALTFARDRSCAHAEACHPRTLYSRDKDRTIDSSRPAPPKVRLCARRSLHPSDVERVIGMVEALETLPDLRQLMAILGHKSVP